MGKDHSFVVFLLGGGSLSSNHVHQIFSFNFGSSVSAQSLLGDLQSLLGILQRTSLQKFYDSFFVAADSWNLSDDWSNQGSSLSEFSFSLSRFYSFRLLGGEFELGDCVALALPYGDVARVIFCHIIIW